MATITGDGTLIGTPDDDLITGGAGSDQLYGLGGNDGLIARGGDDALYGGDGDDVLRGGGGVDTLDGGSNTQVFDEINSYGDRLSFYEAAATQGVIADLGTGTITNDGFGNVESILGIESLGSDTAFVDTFYGNAGSNGLIGNEGDFLYGRGGDDGFYIGAAPAVVDGGAGVDELALNTGEGRLVPDTNGDGFAEQAAAGTSGWTVNLSTGELVDGYGNTGSVVNIENVQGSVFADTIIGNSAANTLSGNDGGDTLIGRGGSDRLMGGAGADTLTGGANADTYVYTSMDESGPTAGDTITDFSGKKAGDGDQIDLSAIDAKESVAGNQAFTLVNKFTGAAGQAYSSYDSANNVTNVYLDDDGDKVADAVIHLLGDVTLSRADFIL